MANYTPTFTKPYPSGWVDKPSKTTPATAAIMNSYDTAIAALEAYLRDNAIDTVSVSVEQFPSDGREWLGTITVGSNQYRIYMPSLKYENSVSDGIKIGTITLGEQSFGVYAPASSAGGSTVSVVPKTLTGTNIAEITVDGTTYQLYAPTGGSGSGSTVTAEATLTEGTQIGKITIDGTETILYAPTASAITVDNALSDTSENPVQNKVVKAEFDKINSNLSNLKYGELAGGKNLFTLKGKEIHTDNVKYEVINENSVSITSNDNCPSNQWVQIVVNGIKVKKNTDYVLSIGNVSNALSDTMCAVVRTDTSKTVGSMYNVQSNALIKFHVSDYDNVFIILRHSQNDSSGASNHTIIWSDLQLEEGTTATDYEPYIPSVKMLASENAQQNDSLSSLGKCKNLLNPNLRTTTLNDVTCTYNGDGTYTLNGTATATTYLNFILNYNFKKDTKIIGCPHKGSADSFGIFIYNVIGGYDYGDGFIFKEDKTTRAGIYIKSGYACNNLVFKPMLTTNLNAAYDDFVPYTGDGDTLTADVASIKKKVDAGGTGGSITVDSALSTESENPVQNKVVTTELNKKLETLDDDSQVPDAVNFDLDSELSLTSVKGVQNKAIAEEFQKYADGTKTVAKATEATTAESATKAAQDAQGNVIDTTYAKKTEVPAGTIVDSELSATSENPVQNKVVKAEIDQVNSNLSDIKDGTTPVAKAVADEDGNNIKNTYVKKTETSETATEDVNVVLNSDLFDSTDSDITCVRIGKLCVLSFTIRAKNTIFSTIDKIVLMSIVGKKYQPKKISAGGRRQIFQGFAVGNYDENGKQSQSLNNTVRIITDWDSNYTEIITRDKDRLNWNGYVQGQIMWVTD